MPKPFRDYHLIKVLTEYEESSLPLDRFLSGYFRSNPALGSKDRQSVGERAFFAMRWKRLLEVNLQEPITWEARLSQIPLVEKLKKDSSLPLPVRCSCPDFLFKLFEDTYGTTEAVSLLLAQNEPAPTTIRINPLKTTREALLKKWEETFSVVPCQNSPLGIMFPKREPLFSLEEFKQGLFEIQDEGSQLLSLLIEAKPKDLILDYCAGSGGKTLGFAHQMGQSGQIFLHDVRERPLMEAKIRLRRAGIQNAQCIPAESKKLLQLKKKMDWVLVDAPCSGTGTWRRNPDMKWTFTEESLKQLIGLQRSIFEKALSFVKPGGKIVYATCSLLKEENQQQVAHFLNTYPIQLVKEPFQTKPKWSGPDGFFAALFTVTEKI